MNRYQKPEVYERLAMEYSLGTLHGRARKRFERLMEQYPYMAAVVESHDKDFAGLVDLLPEVKPDPTLWNKISAELDAQQDQETKADISHGFQKDYDQVGNDIGNNSNPSIVDSLWNVLVNKGLMAAMMLLVVASVFMFKMGAVAATTEFSATLLSAHSHQPMAIVQVQKSTMKMTIKLMEPVTVPEGMQAVVWCIARDHTKPMMNMGSLAANGVTEKVLKKSSWRGIAEAVQFAVSIEPIDAVSGSSPSGELIFLGEIKALTKA